jgi:4-aminobutyrate aminotransferase-like enzyme
MFGIDHSPGAAPDIVAMAKGIAGGFPLGAFMAKEPVSEAMKPGDHLSTFGGNPISCAAALANLEVIREEKLLENSARRGEELLRRLKRLEETSARVGEVRGRGLMVGLELVKDKATKEPHPDEAKRIRATLRENGVLVGVGGAYGNVVRIQPPLSITPGECDRVASALEAALR